MEGLVRLSRRAFIFSIIMLDICRHRSRTAIAPPIWNRTLILMLEVKGYVLKKNHPANTFFHVGKAHLCQTTAALTRLKPVWNDRSISLSSKIRLMRALITLIFLYACES